MNQFPLPPSDSDHDAHRGTSTTDDEDDEAETSVAVKALRLEPEEIERVPVPMARKSVSYEVPLAPPIANARPSVRKATVVAPNRTAAWSPSDAKSSSRSLVAARVSSASYPDMSSANSSGHLRALRALPDPNDPASDPYIGLLIDDRYFIESMLGMGGMGVVYAGRHRVINKRVALKILRADMSQDREMTERFLQEAQAASSIGHPHIVDISDYGHLPDGSAYFVMELLEGQNLAQLMKSVRPVPLQQLLHICRQVVDAVAAAHAQGIVHRDLKPDNIFLARRKADNDYVKILDFGIAKVANSTTTKLTRAGTVFGTPHYMSPEQAAGATVDHRTDIYALGVILYEMASGSVPFHADNYMGILTQHMYRAPVPIRALIPTPDVHPGLEAIILKCLSKKPEQRYGSMEEVLQDLERFSSGTSPVAVRELMDRSGAFNVPADYFQTSGMRSSVIPGMPPHRTRPPWGLYAGAIGLAVAVGTIIVTFGLGSGGRAKSEGSTQAAASAIPLKPSPVVPVPPAESAIATTPAPKGKSVMLISEPRDAEIFDGDQSIGLAPVQVVVSEGKTLTLELRLDGYKTKTVTLDGKRSRLEVKLGHIPAARSSPRSSNKLGDDVIDPWKK